MNDLQKNTENAIQYLKTFYPKADNVLVDEMEVSDDRKRLFISLSYMGDPVTPSELLSVRKELYFKVFEVEIKSGEILSMKNKETY